MSLRNVPLETPIVVNKTLADKVMVGVFLANDAEGDGVATRHWDIPQEDGSMRRYTDEVHESDFTARGVARVSSMLDDLAIMPETVIQDKHE